MVQEFILQRRNRTRQELKSIAALKSLERAIEIAALGQMSDGSRSSHHYRRSRQQLFAGKRRVMAVSSHIRKCKSFDELHDLLSKITIEIPGLGALYTYDAAHIIGTYLGFQPKKVYLHAGTRRGARALGFTRVRYLDAALLPIELNILEPYELEDFLCRYAKALEVWAASR